MKTEQYKFLVVIGFVVLLLVVIGFKPNGRLIAGVSDTDVSAVYKTKCAACHTAKAEKFFDLSKTDEQLAEIILKGKKDAKPPMPEFASKGITPEQAKALAIYMRKLRMPDAANTNVNANANTNVQTNANANTNVCPPVNANANATVNANTQANSNANANVNKIPAEELAALYKAKCAMCHSPKAEKSYDPAVPVEEQVNFILKGKKAAKPPNMPEFESKGITAEKARALAEYMKSLRASN